MRSRELKLLPTATENEYVVVELSYDEGGTSYFSGQVSPRGFYLSCHVETRSEGSRCFNLFGGIKKIVQPAKRFSQKTLETLVVSEEDISLVVNHVINKEQKTLKEVA